jgi:DNA-binding NarL/FixJ family response regulator
MDRTDRRTLRQIRVLIVDDHPLFRDGLQRALEYEDDIIVIGQSEDGASALKISRELRPDVILLDVNLPQINGLQVARHLKNENSHIGVIVLTAYHDSQQVLHTMRAGASAYCPKDITPDKLVETIRNVANGYYLVGETRMTADEIQQWIDARVAAIAGSYMVDSEEYMVPLSPRELEILEFVTNGMSNKEIASRLKISQQTVKNHMTSILKKLNVQDRTQAAVTALRHGWVRIRDNGENKQR